MISIIYWFFAQSETHSNYVSVNLLRLLHSKKYLDFKPMPELQGCSQSAFCKKVISCCKNNIFQCIIEDLY